MYRTVRLHAAAPDKPALGAACNGCGMCCAAEPCPVGMLIYRRRRGACPALAWDEAAQRYLCGIVSDPRRCLPRLPGFAARLLARWARRAIAAGAGCDADMVVD